MSHRHRRTCTSPCVCRLSSSCTPAKAAGARAKPNAAKANNASKLFLCSSLRQTPDSRIGRISLCPVVCWSWLGPVSKLVWLRAYVLKHHLQGKVSRANRWLPSTSKSRANVAAIANLERITRAIQLNPPSPSGRRAELVIQSRNAPLTLHAAIRNLQSGAGRPPSLAGRGRKHANG